jgi:REP element-mobilizing transposase RayT
MAGTYTELFYHLIWATHDREPLIVAELEPRLFGQIRHKCQEIRIQVHALNGMPDHVHLVCTIPPSLSVSEAIRSVKGASSHFVNHLVPCNQPFAWQEGYGALTFSKRDLKTIVAYVDGQKQHHASRRLSDAMERIDEQAGL